MVYSPDIRPEPYRPPGPQQIERARQMYAENFTVSRILAACDMSLGTFYYWFSGGPRDEAGATLYAPIPRRRTVVGRRRKPLEPGRVSLLARLYRTAERQVFDIEQRLAVPAGPTPERERDVRMLGHLTRMLRDLSVLGGEGAGEGAAAAEPEARSPEELQESLLRKLDALVAREDALAREAGQGGER